MKTNFKSPEYLANTGIIYGPYGGIGYYNLNTAVKRDSIKQVFKSFKKTCSPEFLKRLWEGLWIEKAAQTD